MKQVALITGGSRGIGFGVAEALAEKGYNLCICGRRGEQSVEGALEALRDKGAEVMYAKCDVSDAQSRKTMLDAIHARFGQLNVLVNNAGVAPKERRDILDATEESFEWVLKVNLQGPYFLTQSVANWMLEQREENEAVRCCIINVSSISATVASPNRGEYCVSKAGVAMATQLWAVRLAAHNIPVYEVRPGIIATDMTAGVTEKYDKLIAEGLVPQGRWGLPADIGAACVSLAEGNFPFSTGQIVMVDGGLTLQRL